MFGMPVEAVANLRSENGEQAMLQMAVAVAVAVAVAGARQAGVRLVPAIRLANADALPASNPAPGARKSSRSEQSMARRRRA